MEPKLLYKKLSYEIIGLCMEVHTILGKGHNEVIYKDALEYELKRTGIPFARERSFKIRYKEIFLPRLYVADFVIDDSIVLEAKAIDMLSGGNIKQTLNYLAASELRLGLLVNFGENSLKYRRVIL
jgi:GxxExxY protein